MWVFAKAWISQSMRIVVTPLAKKQAKTTTGAGPATVIGTTALPASGRQDMGWAVPGPVLRRDRATTGVTEPLEDGTTAQTDVKDVRKRDIAVFNLYHLQLILFKNASCIDIDIRY